MDQVRRQQRPTAVALLAFHLDQSLSPCPWLVWPVWIAAAAAAVDAGRTRDPGVPAEGGRRGSTRRRSRVPSTNCPCLAADHHYTSRAGAGTAHRPTRSRWAAPAPSVLAGLTASRNRNSNNSTNNTCTTHNNKCTVARTLAGTRITDPDPLLEATTATKPASLPVHPWRQWGLAVSR